MNRFRLISTVVIGASLALTGCGSSDNNTLGNMGGAGNTDSTVTAPLVEVFDSSVAGNWASADPAAGSYTFYTTTTDEPYAAPLKTGRFHQPGKTALPFYWDAKDGTINLSFIDPVCPVQPYSQCKVVSRTTITTRNAAGVAAAWKFDFDDNADGVIDRSVSNQSFKRTKIDPSKLAAGTHYFTKTDLLDTPLKAEVKDGKISIHINNVNELYAQTLVGDVPAQSQDSVALAGTEANAATVTQYINVGGKGWVPVPVKVWFTDGKLSAAGDGYILEYVRHRRVQVPAGANAADYDLGVNNSDTNATIAVSSEFHDFVHGPTIKAGDKFHSFFVLDFDPSVSLLGAVNDLEFTSATDGVLSSTDIHGGKYSESRTFHWQQAADGTLTLQFTNGIPVQIHFIKAVNGGYSMLYTVPHPVFGTVDFHHDFIADAPPVLTQATMPGRYHFANSSGSLPVEVVVHKDGSVTGIVGGHWKVDTDGVLLSYECTDLQGKDIPDYPSCNAALDNLGTMSFVHIRRLNFMSKQGNEYQVKYDSAVYGERFGVYNRDYITVHWTYRWTRVGDE